MKYRCLVLDHDDTIVNSTATIHFPCFQEFMREIRPEISLSLDTFFALNFDPGIMSLFRDICGLSDEEIKLEEQFWSEYVKSKIPSVYEGIREILWDFKKQGGLICVVSHSFSYYIKRDYHQNGLPEPDLIFGWDMDPELRKPNPYSLYQIEKAFSLEPSELLVLDDLKPGYEMARAAGVSFAASGWANDVPSIEAFMRNHCDLYFKTVSDFRDYII